VTGGPFDQLPFPDSGALDRPAEDLGPPPENLVVHPPRSQPPAQVKSSRWDALAPLLNNRLILSALGLVVVLLLIAIVLIAIGHGGGGGTTHVVSAAPTSDGKTPLPRGEVSAKLVNTASLRNGPSATYAILGTIPKGATVAAVGRNSDQTWVQVEYPPGSNLTGWVDVHYLDVTGDISQLSLAAPGPTPVVELPTQSGPRPTAIIVTVVEPTSTPAEETPAVTSTFTPANQATPTPPPIESPTATPISTQQPTG
jgi:uncharacterized protein YraI